jgi:hypothetical protein
MFYYEMRILPVRMPGEVYQIVLGRWVRVNRREGTPMVTFGTLLPESETQTKLWFEVFDALPSDEVGAMGHKRIVCGIKSGVGSGIAILRHTASRDPSRPACQLLPTAER